MRIDILKQSGESIVVGDSITDMFIAPGKDGRTEIKVSYGNKYVASVGIFANRDNAKWVFLKLRESFSLYRGSGVFVIPKDESPGKQTDCGRLSVSNAASREMHKVMSKKGA